MHRHYATIGSTNDAAKEWARDASAPAPHGAVVSSDAQTEGRGRHGRDWVSPAGKGVYLSVIWRPKIAPAQISQLTIVTALAGARALEEIAAVAVETKWPNDLLLNGKKIGGLLCEAGMKSNALDFVVAGVGLNVHQDASDLPLRALFAPTSLFLETKTPWPVADLRSACIRALQEEYSRHEAGEWNAQRMEFLARCAIIGHRVRVCEESSEYSGVATGLDENGLLIVQTAAGAHRVVAGDVSFAKS